MSATTPYRTNTTVHQSSHYTPSRRALGDLTPRTINSPLVESSEAGLPHSPLKKITSHIPSVFADKENLVASPAAMHGKKRRIEEVEDVEKPGSGKMLAHVCDENTWESNMRLTAAAMQRHAENNPVELADAGSPTERNTPTPEPEVIQGSQKSNQSFSDLLNYELCASQKSDQAGPTDAPTPMSASPPASTKPRRTRAETMRTRLKFALYKVRTNQETKCGKDIISSFEANSSSSASIEVPNITISSPRAQPVFFKANLDPFRPIGKLGQPPVQFAIPSDIYGPLGDGTFEPKDGDDADSSGSAHQKLQRLKEQSYQSESLSSSAVTGNAAVGLLELMSGRR